MSVNILPGVGSVPSATNATIATDETSIATPIIGSHNDYLSFQTQQIRSKTIPWEGYEKAGLISDKELTRIRQYETSPASALANNGSIYVTMFLELLSKLTRIDTIQGILVLIDDFISTSPTHPEIFLNIAESNGGLLSMFTILSRLLKKEDEYIRLKSAKILISLVVELKTPSDFDPRELITWISFELKNQNQAVVDIAVQYVQTLLGVSEYRLAFYQNEEAFGTLVSQLKKPALQFQMQYQIIYCLWVCSFIPQIASTLQSKYAVVSPLLDIAKSAIKEKVVRAIVATFKNLVLLAPSQNIVPMLGCKVLPACETLQGRKWVDEEILEDVKVVTSELARNVQLLTTFDEYSSEVKSEKLEWSPPHLSEQFWKTNAQKLNDNDYDLLKTLTRLLSTSTNPITLAVAAHDIGQYVKYYPAGKKFLQESGAKTRVMLLMSHEDSEVRYHALSAVQKFMANAWEF